MSSIRNEDEMSLPAEARRPTWTLVCCWTGAREVDGTGGEEAVVAVVGGGEAVVGKGDAVVGKGDAVVGDGEGGGIGGEGATEHVGSRCTETSLVAPIG